MLLRRILGCAVWEPVVPLLAVQVLYPPCTFPTRAFLGTETTARSQDLEKRVRKSVDVILGSSNTL